MTTMIGISLTGRQVVMVGGGDVAARRIRRFLLDGAIDPRRRARAERGRRRDWSPTTHSSGGRARCRAGDLDDAWLVHTATGDARVDCRRRRAAARQRRILCINAGDGSHGSARLAAETRSGDSIVGVVSDAGVDPGRTAPAARRDRRASCARVGCPCADAAPTAVGHVHLVGGGPGPVDLITVRGRRLLAEADVVVADRLGPTGVIGELAPEVEVIDVGKRPQHHPVPQHEINEILDRPRAARTARRASQGRRPVRLRARRRGGRSVPGCGGPRRRRSRAHEHRRRCRRPPASRSRTAAPPPPCTSSTVRTPRPTATLAALRDPQTTTVVLMGVSALAALRRRGARRRCGPASCRWRSSRAATPTPSAPRARRSATVAATRARGRRAQSRGDGLRSRRRGRPAAAATRREPRRVTRLVSIASSTVPTRVRHAPHP